MFILVLFAGLWAVASAKELYLIAEKMTYTQAMQACQRSSPRGYLAHLGPRELPKAQGLLVPSRIPEAWIYSYDEDRSATNERGFIGYVYNSDVKGFPKGKAEALFETLATDGIIMRPVLCQKDPPTYQTNTTLTRDYYQSGQPLIPRPKSPESLIPDRRTSDPRKRARVSPASSAHPTQTIRQLKEKRETLKASIEELETQVESKKRKLRKVQAAIAAAKT